MAYTAKSYQLFRGIWKKINQTDVKYLLCFGFCHIKNGLDVTQCFVISCFKAKSSTFLSS